MSSHNGALLEWRPILRGWDVEETRAYLRAGFGQDLQFEPARGQGGRTDVRIEGIDLPSMLIHHVRSATGTAIEGSLSGTTWSLPFRRLVASKRALADSASYATHITPSFFPRAYPASTPTEMLHRS